MGDGNYLKKLAARKTRLFEENAHLAIWTRVLSGASDR
jgi:hypothetical protein